MNLVQQARTRTAKAMRCAQTANLVPREEFTPQLISINCGVNSDTHSSTCNVSVSDATSGACTFTTSSTGFFLSRIGPCSDEQGELDFSNAGITGLAADVFADMPAIRCKEERQSEQLVLTVQLACSIIR